MQWTYRNLSSRREVSNQNHCALLVVGNSMTYESTGTNQRCSGEVPRVGVEPSEKPRRLSMDVRVVLLRHGLPVHIAGSPVDVLPVSKIRVDVPWVTCTTPIRVTIQKAKVRIGEVVISGLLWVPLLWSTWRIACNWISCRNLDKKSSSKNHCKDELHAVF